MKPLAKTYNLGGMTSIYVLPDRVEVGQMGPIYNEDLRRLAFRDIRRLYVWHTWWVGRVVVGILPAAALLVTGVVVGASGGLIEGAAALVALAVLVGAFVVWSSRPARFMKFRLVGLNVAVDGNVGGSAKKQAKVRDAILAGLAASRGGAGG